MTVEVRYVVCEWCGGDGRDDELAACDRCAGTGLRPEADNEEHQFVASAIPLRAEAELDAKPSVDDDRLWSVTSILGAFGESDALIEWSAQETAKTAIRSEATWRAMRDDAGEGEAIKWLAGARYRPSKGERSATLLGQLAHALFEEWVVTGIRPDADAELAPYLDSFANWLDHFQPSYTAAEVTVYHPEFGYAGTADGYATVQRTDFIIDYKTSKKSLDGRGNRTKPWHSVALQMAAYRHAAFAAVWRARRYEQYRRRYYLLSKEERDLAVPTPDVEGGLVIHVTPEHCDVYPVDCGPAVFDSFLYAVEAARWSFDMSKRVIGEPIALLDTKRTP